MLSKEETIQSICRKNNLNPNDINGLFLWLIKLAFSGEKPNITKEELRAIRGTGGDSI